MSSIAVEELLEKLRVLKPHIKERYRAKQIELFGSNIRGKQIEGSPGSVREGI